MPAQQTTSIEATLALFAQRPERIAITQNDRSLTYGELLNHIYRTARALQAQGIRRRDVVALATGNRPETFVLRYAANLLGCCTTVLYDDLAAPLIAEILHTIDARIVVFAGDQDAVVEAVRDVPGVTGLALGALEERATTESAEPMAVQARREDLSSIRLTGGSTGIPKGIPQDFSVPFYLAPPALKMWEDATQLMCTAIGHLAGTLAEAVLAAGGRVVLQDWFQPDQVLAAIERERITFLWIQPAMLHQLLDHPQLDSTDTSSLRSLMVSGGPSVPHRISQALKRFGPIITQGYGAYEIGQVTILSPAEHERPELLTTVGRPAPGVELNVRDPDGQPVEVGATGEIWVRGPGMMPGYYKQPEQTAEVLRDGWLHTRDLGFVDEEGYLTVVGRSKDVIIGIRETVYPLRVENVLHQHPNIQQAVVFGVAGSDNDEKVCAAVIPTEQSRLTEEDVAQWVRKKLGGAYAPEVVLVLDHMPTTGSDKPDRTALRELVTDRINNRSAV